MSIEHGSNGEVEMDWTPAMKVTSAQMMEGLKDWIEAGRPEDPLNMITERIAQDPEAVESFLAETERINIQREAETK